MFLTGFVDYMKTLSSLQSLKPEILCLGHQGAITSKHITPTFNRAKVAANKVVETVQADSNSNEVIAKMIFKKYYVDEFKLYNKNNIMNCCRILVKCAGEALKETTNRINQTQVVMKCEQCGRKVSTINGYVHKSECLCENCYMDARETRSRKTHWRYIRSVKDDYLQPVKKTDKKNDE